MRSLGHAADARRSRSRDEPRADARRRGAHGRRPRAAAGRRAVPAGANLPIDAVRSAGTDHAIYRLGERLAVRLPRIESATAQIAKEQEWLPRLAPHLPLAIPTPLAKGAPAEGYPWHWSVYGWLDGETATTATIEDPADVATRLAKFVTALRLLDQTDGPPPGAHNFHRGVPLAHRDASTRAAIVALDGVVDARLVTAAWEHALHAAMWQDEPVWIHGDLQPNNLLVHRGMLTAVIDFGGLAVGDPACDLMVAWTTLAAKTRVVFRAGLDIDDATWARGRGWALSFGLIALPYYRDSNPELTRIARVTIDEVLADHQHTSS